jgi:N-acetylglucosamine-6-phosphate deacetylase
MIGTQLNAPRGRFALCNGRVVLSQRVSAAGEVAVVVDGETIAGVTEEGTLGSDVERIDVGGRLVTPGLIDIHTHGAVGYTFNDPTPTAFAALLETNLKHGVTGLLGTVAPAAIADMVRCFEFAERWISEEHEGAQLLGIHVEGPYMNPAQKGALDPAHLHTPDDGTADILLEHHTVMRIMALAPELPGALELIKRLVRLGIVPSAGHTMAKDEQVLAAMACGLRHVTHIWSAMSSTVREGPWRKPGLLEMALLRDDLTVEMIADNRHLPATLMKLAFKCVGPERLCAISDATSGAGLPEGTRFKMGEMEYEVSDGVGMMFDRSAFAGSTTLVNQMLPVLTNIVGISLPDAVRMLTLTPAATVGLDYRKGDLAAGKDADLAIFNDDYTAWRAMIAGRWAYAQ